MSRVLNPKNHWATPKNLLKELDQAYKFSRDPGTGKLFDPCPLFCDLTKFNGLEVEWPKKTFVNPPYDLQGKTAFVKKAFEEYQLGKTIVMLLPVSTSTKLFHEVIYPNATILFLSYRPKYEGINSKGEWVNPYNAIIDNEIRLQLRMLDNGDFNLRKKVSSGGAHDAMLVEFGPPS
jgi:hypothetical protein